MTKRLALSLFVTSVLLITVAYASALLPGDPPVWAPWVMAAGTALSLVSVMAVGAARKGRVAKRLAAAFGLVLAVLVAGFAALLALPPTDPGDPALWLGLPPRAAVLLYGVGVLPFFIVPVAYAWTFDAMTLSQADLDRVREAAGAGAAGAADAAGAMSRSDGAGEAPGRSGRVAGEAPSS